MTSTTTTPRKDTSLLALDRAHLIHPVASWRGHEQRGATVLQSGRGAWLVDDSGKELLDAFSGLWCVNIGYGHESVIQAATEQMRKLPYATGYFGYASEPAIRLAAKLADIAPAGLNHVYLTLGGSEAVDAAVRLIVQYYNAIGRPAQEAVHLAAARLSRLVIHRRGPYRAAGFPPRLRPAARRAALHCLALPLPQSGGQRCRNPSSPRRSQPCAPR